MMRPRPQKSRSVQGKGTNWMLVAGGALISSLSIHIGYKLKQTLESKQQAKAASKGGLCHQLSLAISCVLVLMILYDSGNGNSPDWRQPGIPHSQPTVYTYGLDEDNCFNCNSGDDGMVEIKNPPNGHILSEPESSLSLVTVSAPEYHQENGNVWISSPERIELPPKRFHHSNCSDSPCASDSGSDAFSKREVIQKLRQQLKRRDDLILEMQDQIAELQNALNSQVSHSNQLQSQLDVANTELFDSEREIQRLRKAIADHCVGHVECKEKISTENGYVNGNCNSNIEMLKNEIGELKDVIEGKDFLVQNYKEQKSELSIKIKELQQRLDSQLPNIL